MNSYKEPETLLECLELQSHYVGIPKITKKTAHEFYKRGKTIQVLGMGFLTKKVDPKVKENLGRMPTLKEVEANIDLSTNASKLDPKKWRNVVSSLVNDITNRLIEYENKPSDD